MKKITLLFTFTFFSAVLLAQNALVLTGPKGQTDVLHNGSYLVFGIKADKSVHQGYIKEITDSSLVFENSQVSLSQIDVLGGNTRERIRSEKTAETVATVFIVGGITALCLASAFTFHPNYNHHFHSDFVFPHVWINLGYIIDLGTCPIDRSVHLRDYSKWSAYIMKENMPEKTAEKENSEKPKKQKKSGTNKSDEVYGE